MPDSALPQEEGTDSVGESSTGKPQESGKGETVGVPSLHSHSSGESHSLASPDLIQANPVHSSCPVSQSSAPRSGSETIVSTNKDGLGSGVAAAEEGMGESTGPQSPAFVPKRDDRLHLLYPKDPIQIGSTIVDGNLQPVWVDPTDFILSPDQKLQQKSNQFHVERSEALHQCRLQLAARVETWLSLTLAAIVPERIFQSPSKLANWLKSEDINYVEDNSVEGVHKFVLRRGDRVLSEFEGRLVESR